jgi:adenylate kinase
MAVPIQTWGSLGRIGAEQRDFAQSTTEYLEANEVYDLFKDLLHQVVIHQPENPIKFLQDQLKAKPPLSICVIGPPGISRSKYCQQLAQDYNIKHIHVGKLLRAKKELKEVIEAGDLVDDQTVISTVKAELSKARFGWVLDGFPRTKVQAQALTPKEAGFCLDKVLLLYTGEAAIRKRYAAKVAAQGFSAAEKEDLISTRLQKYQRHVISIVELYKNVIKQIEVSASDDDQNMVYGMITRCLQVRPYSNATQRPHRISVIGPPGAGRSTQCRALSTTYGLVHVDLAPLVTKYQLEIGLKTEELPPEYIGDEELCSIVGKRLNEIDCARKGWVLDGFPKTQAQAEFLRQSHLWPTRLIALQLSEEDVLMRCSARRVDPVTRAAYYKPPNNVEVRQRLIQAEYDQQDNLRSRYRVFHDNLDKVRSTFPLKYSAVMGDGSPSEVTEEMQKTVDKALPSELEQDPSSNNGA